jgi:hypothetical protein
VRATHKPRVSLLPRAPLTHALHVHPSRCYPLLLPLLLRPLPSCSWYNHLDPNIRRGPWDEAEDRAIISLQHKLGNKWAEIATEIPGRRVAGAGVAYCIARL